jgi:hypothetical protein
MLVLLMPIVARQSLHLPPSVFVCVFSVVTVGFFDLGHIDDLPIPLFVHIIVRAYQRRNRSCASSTLRALAATIILRRHYYLAPTIIINRPPFIIDRRHVIDSSAIETTNN